MKRLLFDVNVILDVLLDREPHVEAGAAAWATVETGVAEGLIAAHAVTTIYYLVQKEAGAAKARRTISALLKVFSVAIVDKDILREALDLPCPDFEDAVTAAAARHSGCDVVLTRDPRGFRGSLVPPMSPEAVLPLIPNI